MLISLVTKPSTPVLDWEAKHRISRIDIQKAPPLLFCIDCVVHVARVGRLLSMKPFSLPHPVIGALSMASPRHQTGRLASILSYLDDTLRLEGTDKSRVPRQPVVVGLICLFQSEAGPSLDSQLSSQHVLDGAAAPKCRSRSISHVVLGPACIFQSLLAFQISCAVAADAIVMFVYALYTSAAALAISCTTMPSSHLLEDDLFESI